jgi:hypothetical protein
MHSANQECSERIAEACSAHVGAAGNMSAMQALKGGHTIQRRGLDTHLSDYASKEKVCTVCMVQIADCKALLRVSVLAVSWLTFTLRTHMHSVQAYGSAANNRLCLRLALL